MRLTIFAPDVSGHAFGRSGHVARVVSALLGSGYHLPSRTTEGPPRRAMHFELSPSRLRTPGGELDGYVSAGPEVRRVRRAPVVKHGAF